MTLIGGITLRTEVKSEVPLSRSLIVPPRKSCSIQRRDNKKYCFVILFTLLFAFSSMSSSRDPTKRYQRPVLGDKSSSSSKRVVSTPLSVNLSVNLPVLTGFNRLKPIKRNKGHFVKGGVQVSNMEGVPDVAYDEVKESHYRDKV